MVHRPRGKTGSASVQSRTDEAGNYRQVRSTGNRVRDCGFPTTPPAPRFGTTRSMKKPVAQVSDVVVRFAGDSGDGMQLTGRVHERDGAVRQRPRRRCPTSRPRSARPPARSPGVSGFQIHFADHDILTPGDQPDVLVAMNPAALKTNLNDLRDGRDADRQPRRVQRAATCRRRATRRTRSRTARSTTTRCTRSRSRRMTVEALQGRRGRHAARGGAVEELVRARPDVVALRPPDRADARLHRGEVRASGRSSPRRTSRALQGRLQLRRDDRGLRGLVRGQAREAARPGIYRNITGNQALALGLVAAGVQRGLPLFLGAYPITPASSILEELSRATSTSASARSRPRTRSRRPARRSARRSAARSASPPRPGPGIVLKAETVGLGDDARAAARHHRRPARRAVHGHADEARAGRPADGAVRPQRRVAGARCSRRRSPARLLRRRRSRPCGSRSSTGRPCSCSRTPTSRTAPSRG